MIIRYNQDLVTQDPQAEHFILQFWQQAGQHTGSAGGRNLAYFIAADNKLSPLPMVLRHYYRGGLVGKVNRDWFLRESLRTPTSGYLVAPPQSPGLRAARSIAEFELLAWMHEQGLPVPRPIAAQLKFRCGLWYQADILIERLPADGDVFVLLKQQALPQQVWQQLGHAIAKMHQQGVYHSDLNCHNLLVALDSAGPRVWLIDFDKCERRAAGDWTQGNLERLRRSFDKEKGLHQNFHFNDENWQWLLDAYQAAAEA